MSSIKCVFLDFDGVLNDQLYLKSKRESGLYKGTEWPWLEMIDPTKVALLNQIIEATQAKVVVSSSWRIANTQEQLQSYLNHHGFIGEIIGTTTRKMSNNYRGNEIKWTLEYMKEDGIDVEKFVILDDNSDMLELKKYLIQTSFTPLIGDDSGGLQQRHIDLAIERLEIEEGEWVCEKCNKSENVCTCDTKVHKSFGMRWVPKST